MIIITAALVYVGFRQTQISNKATDAALRQVIAFEKSQAASLDIFDAGNMINKSQWSGNIRFTFRAEIVNANMVTAKNIETKSRVDLRQKDFESDNIVYKANTIKRQPPLTNLGEIIIRDTSKNVYKIAEIDTTGKWAFWHINATYDNGFGKEEIRNWGYRFDLISKEKYRCEHNN